MSDAKLIPLQAAQSQADEAQLRLERLRWSALKGDISGAVDSELASIEQRLARAREPGPLSYSAVGGSPAAGEHGAAEG